METEASTTDIAVTRVEQAEQIARGVPLPLWGLVYLVTIFAMLVVGYLLHAVIDLHSDIAWKLLLGALAATGLTFTPTPARALGTLVARA